MPQPDSAPLAGIVDRNIRSLIARQRDVESRRSAGDRIAYRITCFSGSLAFVWIHFAIVAVWVLWNVGWLGLRPFDGSFVILACVASVEAIFLSTFVLITQNRMAAQAAKRSELDLQISLLAEHEVTRLLGMVTQMAQRMGLPASNDPELGELVQDVLPERVLERMEEIDQPERT